jgi:hypothetical protein
MSMNMYVFAGNPFGLRALANDTERLHQLSFEPEDAGEQFSIADLHKSWHLLREVLGRARSSAGDPGAFIFEGGTEVGGDAGYGPPRLLMPEATASVWSLIQPIDDQRLDELLDLNALGAQEVIYGVHLDEPREQLLEEVRMYMGELQRVLSVAAERGWSILVVMS